VPGVKTASPTAPEADELLDALSDAELHAAKAPAVTPLIAAAAAIFKKL
jgi:hypothetical protein